MRVPEQRIAETAFQACELMREPGVIGLPVLGDASGDLRLGHFLTVQVERLLVERVDRHHTSSVLPGIKVGVVRRPVKVDDVARVRRDQHRSAELVERVIERLEMPVGIGQGAGGRRQARE